MQMREILDPAGHNEFNLILYISDNAVNVNTDVVDLIQVVLFKEEP
jgi:hypothetical protein